MNLSYEKVQHLKVMTHHTGWSEILEPYLRARGNELIRLLLMPPSERPEPYRSLEENIVRGEIRGIEGVLRWVQNQIVAADHNQKLDELDAQARTNSGDTANP